MKWVFLALIKLYWKILPENKRRSCLFKETCSHYVYRHIVEHGFFSGCKALRLRIKKCRKDYYLQNGIQGIEMKLADGSIIKEEEISPNILSPICSHMNIILEQIKKADSPSQS